jgi:cytochrome b6-f complex iron-sulfur subunit
MVALFLGIFAFTLVESRRRRLSPTAQPGMEPADAPAVRSRRPATRRDFLRGGLIASLAIFGAEFGGASLAFLSPNLKGEFGSRIVAGSLSDIKAYIESQNQPYYFGAGRFYIVSYNGAGTSSIYKGLVEDGLMALYQKCPHLGCRVPYCQQSEWFECPCHGSKYNRAGEYELGPAPTGMMRFPLSVEGDEVVVDTSVIIGGPPRGTDTIHEPPQGPFCVGGSAGG